MRRRKLIRRSSDYDTTYDSTANLAHNPDIDAKPLPYFIKQSEDKEIKNIPII